MFLLEIVTMYLKTAIVEVLSDSVEKTYSMFADFLEDLFKSRSTPKIEKDVIKFNLKVFHYHVIHTQSEYAGLNLCYLPFYWFVL